MTYAEFESTLNHICTMSELVVHKEKSPASHDPLTAAKDQRQARDDVVYNLLKWAKEKAIL